MVQKEKLQLPFGVYVGEARDGRPNGHGEVNFNQDDNIVRRRGGGEGGGGREGQIQQCCQPLSPRRNVPDLACGKAVKYLYAKISQPTTRSLISNSYCILLSSGAEVLLISTDGACNLVADV